MNSSEGGGRGGGPTSTSPLLGRSPGSRSEENGGRERSSPRTTSSSETTPTLSSGMEILAGHPKDIPLGTYRPPVPGALDPLNPAFRMPGCLGGLPGYPSTSSVAGSVCRDPYCKDPNCPTAVYNAYMARVSAARGLPPGYLELMEAHKMAALGAHQPRLIGELFAIPTNCQHLSHHVMGLNDSYHQSNISVIKSPGAAT